MRGLWVRKPLRKYWQGRPMSLFDEEAKAYFLAAGYAVATIDVRPLKRCFRLFGDQYGIWTFPSLTPNPSPVLTWSVCLYLTPMLVSAQLSVCKILLSRLKCVLYKAQACIHMQVRGTGASGGQWRMPWGFEERKDTAQVLDWLVGQRWSNGQVTPLVGTNPDIDLSLTVMIRRGVGGDRHPDSGPRHYI